MAQTDEEKLAPLQEQFPVGTKVRWTTTEFKGWQGEVTAVEVRFGQAYVIVQPLYGGRKKALSADKLPEPKAVRGTSLEVIDAYEEAPAEEPKAEPVTAEASEPGGEETVPVSYGTDATDVAGTEEESDDEGDEEEDDSEVDHE